MKTLGFSLVIVFLVILFSGCAPAPSVEPTATDFPTVAPTLTALPPTATPKPQPAGIGLIIDESSPFASYLNGLATNLPIQWKVPRGADPLYEVSFTVSEIQYGDTCTYLPKGKVIRYKIVIQAKLLDRAAHNRLAEQTFTGAEQNCPDTWSFEKDEKSDTLKSYPLSDEFHAWLKSTLETAGGQIPPGPVIGELKSISTSGSLDGEDICRLQELDRWHLPEAPARYAEIVNMAFSNQGSILAVTDWNHQIYLWDLIEGKLKTTLVSGESSFGEQVYLSPDGSRILTISEDRITAWLVSNGSQVYTQTDFGSGHDQVVDLTPDGNTVATRDLFGGINLWFNGDPWQHPGWEFRNRFDDLSNGGFGWFSNGLEILATIDQNRTSVKLWEVSTGKLSNTLEMPKGTPGKITMVAFSPDGTLLAIGTDTGWQHMYRTESGVHLFSRENSDRVYDLNFLGDGLNYAYIVSGFGVVVRSTSRGDVVYSIEFSDISDLSILGENFMVTSYHEEGKLVMWDEVAEVYQPCPRTLPILSGNDVVGIIISPDHSLLAIANGPQIKLFGIP